MVTKKSIKKGMRKQPVTTERKTRITADTPHGICRDRLTAFGGLLPLVKFLDLVGFDEKFKRYYIRPKRITQLGCLRMITGLLMLLFIGFQRLGHFKYIRDDSMLCGFLNVRHLPDVSTFWRYLRSLGIVQSKSLVRLNAALRRTVWSLCGYQPRRVTIGIDTTVSTVYGSVEGARKGHNPKHRGKKGLRPILCFIQETREYLCGTQRRGETISAREVAHQIRQFWSLVPACVRQVVVLGDGEMVGWPVIQACEEEGFEYIFANRACAPKFSDASWYRHKEYEYNECWYKPNGWSCSRRFVVMRIRKDQMGDRQLKLFDADCYAYRIFVTNMTDPSHKVIARYDQRADAENLIKEAQHEGILSIPSKSFHANHAFFQIVMLAFNLWRSIKMLAACRENLKRMGNSRFRPGNWPDPTIRMMRLKSLFIAARIRFHGNRDEVRYSIHDARSSGLIDVLDFLDLKKKEVSHAA